MAFSIVSSRPMTGLVLVEPPEIHLTHSLESKKFALTITNTTSETIAWKLKTNRQGRYMVSPKQGIVQPENRSTCAIVLTKPEAREYKKPDKFLIQAVRVGSVMSDAELAALWRDRETKHDKKRGAHAFQETTVICHLHYQSNTDSVEGRHGFPDDVNGVNDRFETASVVSSMTATSFAADDARSSVAISEGRPASEDATLPPRPPSPKALPLTGATVPSQPIPQLVHPAASSVRSAPQSRRTSAVNHQFSTSQPYTHVSERNQGTPTIATPPRVDQSLHTGIKSPAHEVRVDHGLSIEEIRELQSTKKKYTQLLDNATRWKKQYIELEDRIRLLEQSKEGLFSENKTVKEQNKQLLDELRKLQGDNKPDEFDTVQAAREESREPFSITKQRESVRDEANSFSLPNLFFMIFICVLSYYIGSRHEKAFH